MSNEHNIVLHFDKNVKCSLCDIFGIVSILKLRAKASQSK